MKWLSQVELWSQVANHFLQAGVYLCRARNQLSIGVLLVRWRWADPEIRTESGWNLCDSSWEIWRC